MGLFLVAGLAALAWLSVSLGDVSFLPRPRYRIEARFATVGDLKAGAPVKMAGVRIGEVQAIALRDWAAEVTLAIDEGIELPKDTAATIRTAGLLGEAYVSLTPGGAEENLADGGRITQTEPPLDLFDLIGKYAFGDATKGDGDGGTKDDGLDF